MLYDMPDWMAQANCLGLWHEFDEGRATRMATRTCAECDVSAQCALWMLQHEVGKARDYRATYAAGMSTIDRAKVDARAPRCVGCGVRTGAGPCESCIRPTYEHLNTRRPLRCIQCGETMGRETRHDALHCSHCVHRGDVA